MAETPRKASPKKTAASKKASESKPVSEPIPAKTSEAVAAPKKAVRKPAGAGPVVPAEKPRAAAKKAPGKTVEKTPKASAPAASLEISDEARYRMIAEAAYYRAESQQFQSDPVRDWIDAEKDIEALLSGGKK